MVYVRFSYTNQLGTKVKYLLIVLTILLLSSFLTSCDKKEETLYGWEISSGLEWRTIGDKSKNPKYKGEVRREYIIFGDYIIEGQGSVTYPDGRQYVGEFKDGKENGYGIFTSSDGKKYIGEFKDGSSHGQGTLTTPDGRKYTGGNKYGLPNGKGTYTWSDGRRYVGGFKDEKFHGQGTLTVPDGRKYKGEWKDGKPWNISLLVKKGNLKLKWVNGKKIKL